MVILYTLLDVKEYSKLVGHHSSTKYTQESVTLGNHCKQ